MESLESSVFWIEVNSSLVTLLQVVANVQESRSSECVTKMTDFGIGCYRSGEPIIGDTNGRNTLSLAHELEAGLAKDRDLVNNEIWLSIWIWTGEKIRVVKEDNLDTLDETFMDTELGSTSDVYKDVVDVINAILMKVASLSLSVPFIIWRDDNYFLSKIGKTY